MRKGKIMTNAKRLVLNKGLTHKKGIRRAQYFIVRKMVAIELRKFFIAEGTNGITRLPKNYLPITNLLTPSATANPAAK